MYFFHNSLIELNNNKHYSLFDIMFLNSMLCIAHFSLGKKKKNRTLTNSKARLSTTSQKFSKRSVVSQRSRTINLG